jgi:hypothetical protein
VKSLIKYYRSFDGFLKMQLAIILIINLGWALIIPIVYKMQGMLWTTSMISGYLILSRATGLVSPYFRNVELKQSYLNLIILDFFYMLSINIYYFSGELFLHVEAFLGIVYSIFLTVFHINYNAYVMDKYETEIYKDMKYCETAAASIAGILGYSIVILLENSFGSRNSIFIFEIILILAFWLQIYNYKKYYS